MKGKEQIANLYRKLAALAAGGEPGEAESARARMRELEAAHPWVKNSGHLPKRRRSRAELQTILDHINRAANPLAGPFVQLPTLSQIYVSGMRGGVRPDAVDVAIERAWEELCKAMKAAARAAEQGIDLPPHPASENPPSFWDVALAVSQEMPDPPCLPHHSKPRPASIPGPRFLRLAEFAADPQMNWSWR